MKVRQKILAWAAQFSGERPEALRLEQSCVVVRYECCGKFTHWLPLRLPLPLPLLLPRGSSMMIVLPLSSIDSPWCQLKYLNGGF